MALPIRERYLTHLFQSFDKLKRAREEKWSREWRTGGEYIDLMLPAHVTIYLKKHKIHFKLYILFNIINQFLELVKVHQNSSELHISYSNHTSPSNIKSKKIHRNINSFFQLIDTKKQILLFCSRHKIFRVIS